MLPNTFSSSLPPDHPPRSRKRKNGPKKQPQRGLGVAQLEKLRLQEQSKQQQQQQEAACLASLRHYLPPLSDAFYIPSHHQVHQQLRLPHSLKAGSFHVISPPSGCTTIQFQQQQNQQQQLPLGGSLAPYGKLSFDHNGVNNSFLPFPSVTVAGASRQSLCIDIMQQAGTVENCSPCSSQVHDLCSPRSGISNTISLSEQPVSRASPIRNNANRFIIDDLRGANVRLDSPTLLSSILTSQAESKVAPMQIQQTGSKWKTLQVNVKEPVNSFSPIKEWSKEEEMQSSNEPPKAQNQGAPMPVTDLRLFDHSPGPLANPHNQPRNREEASVTTMSLAPAESLELSSFQINCSDQGWSLSDQVPGRRRPWTSMQEITRNSVDLQGMFLNKLMRENRPKLNEQDMPADIGTVLMRTPQTPTSTSIYRSSAALRNSDKISVKTGLFPSIVLEMHDYFPASNNCLSSSNSQSGFSLISKNLPLLEVWPISCNSRKDCFTAPSHASLAVNCKKDYGLIPEMESNFLTLGLSGSLCGMHEQSMLHNGRKGQHQSSCEIARMKEVQMPQYYCAEQDESKIRLQPWMCCSTILCTGERDCVSERNNPSKAMSEFQRIEAKNRQHQEEEREERAVPCLDLNLKLSL